MTRRTELAGRLRQVAGAAAVTVLAAAAMPAATPAPVADVLVSGCLLDEVGEPVPGALVVLQVWPPREVRAGWTEDEQFELDDIGTATTRPDGWYTVRISRATDLSVYQSTDGIIDIDVLGLTEEGLAAYGFSIVPDDFVESEWPELALVDFDTGEVISPVHVMLRIGGPGEVPGADPAIPEDGHDHDHGDPGDGDGDGHGDHGDGAWRPEGSVACST